jgi:hypothetical protein
MKRAMIVLSALGLVAVAAQPAPAAWDNVFQPTLFNRNRQPAVVTQYYVPPTVVQSSPIVVGSSPCNTCNPCPQTTCSQSYVQRCYYQPVVTYQTQTYYEPVTTYKTSYYYEPVTTYRYSAYYDPCSCGYQQVATPCTSYQLKAQSSPVQSWVARCTQVPVTTYQKSCYYQPQTTCCTTTPGPVIPATPAPPIIDQQTAPSMRDLAPPQVEEKRAIGTGGSMSDRLYPPSQPQAPVMPPASMKLPQPSPTNPSVKLEGIVMGPDARVDGQVVRNDNSPKANAKLMFVGAQAGQRYFATANTAGRFSVSLPSGNWNVYVYGADDLPTYSTQVSVTGSRQPAFTLVSR